MNAIKKIAGRVGALVGTVVTASTAVVAISASPALAAPDGYLYAWEHDARGGVVCMWQGNDRDWSSCGVHGGTTGRNLRNKASSIHNNGYTHAVRIYENPGANSAYACLHVGTAWWYMDRDFNQVPHKGPKFNLGGAIGRDEFVNENMAGHTWHRTCT